MNPPLPILTTLLPCLLLLLSPTARTWWKPQPGTTWQIQLNQPVNTSFNAAMYDVDLIDTPQSVIDQLHSNGRIVVCYFSAGTHEKWRPADWLQFPNNTVGQVLLLWRDERWLDIRSEVVKQQITRRLDLARTKKCDGVDPNNLDAYTEQSGFNISKQDQLAYVKWLFNEAHTRDLGVGLKKLPEFAKDLASLSDWAISERFIQYNQYFNYRPFIDAKKPIFNIEWEGDPKKFCATAASLGNATSTIKKLYNLNATRIACNDNSTWTAIPTAREVRVYTELGSDTNYDFDGTDGNDQQDTADAYNGRWGGGGAWG